MTTTNTIRPGAYISPSRRRACNRCGKTELAWWQSSRTGRWVLVNTVESQDDIKRARDVRWIAPWMPHRCDQVLQRQAEHEAWMDKQRLHDLLKPLDDSIMDAVVAGDDDHAKTLIVYRQQVVAEFEAGTFDGYLNGPPKH